MLRQNALLLIGALLLNNLVVMNYLARPLRQWPVIVATTIASCTVVCLALLLHAIAMHFLTQLAPAQLYYWLILLPLVALLTQVAASIAPRIKPGFAPVHEPLLLTHSALAAIGLSLVDTGASLPIESAFILAGTAGAYALLIPLFCALRERTQMADVPTPFRGAAIDMLSAGLATLGCLGLAGMF